VGVNPSPPQLINEVENDTPEVSRREKYSG
jgi:hypothetical protein